MKSSKTKGRIQLATDRLAAEKPLHAGILAQWRLAEDTSIDTMGIGFQRGRLTLYYNPAFVDAISLDELQAVLEHEVLHVLYGHCEHESADGENHRAMTIAQEVTVNEWVSGPLPGNPYLLDQYPSLPFNESTDDRYQKLLSILPEEEKGLDDHSRWEQLRGQLGSAVIASAVARGRDILPSLVRQYPKPVAETCDMCPIALFIRQEQIVMVRPRHPPASLGDSGEIIKLLPMPWGDDRVVHAVDDQQRT